MRHPDLCRCLYVDDQAPTHTELRPAPEGFRGTAPYRAAHSADSMLSVDRFGHRRHDGVLIYLDICCFNRPFDQQTQTDAENRV